MPSDGQHPRSASRPRRPRALLSCYNAHPEFGSESSVGWNRALAAAEVCDACVLVGPEFAPGIRRHFRQYGKVPGLKVLAVRPSRLGRLLSRMPGLFYLSYRLWQKRALQIARRLEARKGFDLVHHVNYCGFREPGYLWKLDAPFVWGPVGGTQNYPWRFLGEAGFKGAARELLRSILNDVQLRFSLRVRRAARRAAVLLAANTTNQADLAQAHGVRPRLLSDTGVTRLDPAPHELRTDDTLRILWSGNHEAHKALSLLLKALAQLPADIVFDLHVLGCGSLTRRWQRLAERLGVAPCVRWLGQLPLSDALEHRKWADIFVFTSLRDTTGTVVLEALAGGLPVVALDHQGVGDVVTPESGVKIPVTTPREVTLRMAEALAALARDPARREALGRGALARAAEYLWDRNSAAMLDVYREVLASRQPAPQPQSTATSMADCLDA